MPPGQPIEEESEYPSARAALGMIVIGDCLRIIDDAETVLPETPAPIDILQVHEEAVIHRSDRERCLALDEHRRPGNPIDSSWRCVVILAHQEPVEMPTAKWQAAEPGAAIEYRLGLIVAETAQLERPVEIHLLRSDELGLWMLLEVAHERRYRITLDEDIAVDEEDIFAPRFFERSIEQLLETDIVSKRKEPGFRKLFAHDELSILLGRAVGNNHLIRERSPLELAIERLEAEPEEFRILVAVDSDRDERFHPILLKRDERSRLRQRLEERSDLIVVVATRQDDRTSTWVLVLLREIEQSFIGCIEHFGLRLDIT